VKKNYASNSLLTVRITSSIYNLAGNIIMQLLTFLLSQFYFLYLKVHIIICLKRDIYVWRLVLIANSFHCAP